MSTSHASAAGIDAHLAELADQIDHRPMVKQPQSQKAYKVVLVVTGANARSGGPTGDKTANAAAARAKLERGRRNGQRPAA